MRASKRTESGATRTGRWRRWRCVLAALLALGLAVGRPGCTPAEPRVPEAPAWDALSRSVAFEYRSRIESLPADAQRVTVWLPVPQSDAWQRVDDLEIQGPFPFETVEEPVYGNRFARFAGDAPLPDAAEFVLRFRVTRVAVHPDAFDAGHLSPRLDPRYLQPDRLVPIDGAIARESSEVAPRGLPPLVAARKIYDHVVDTVRYDKTGEGWGRGDALRACDVRAGNCTDFHSLFIGLSRASGLAARFIMGVALPLEAEGEIPGYHCWAEFYTPEGWRPVDASEASKHPERVDALFGGLDAHRVCFTVGRDIPIPGSHGDPQNFVIWPYVEVDGRVHPTTVTRLSYRNIVR